MNDLSMGVQILKDNLQGDMDYAWSWFCNIAVPMQDEGVSHETSNKAAARVMQNLFGVDITKCEHYKY